MRITRREFAGAIGSAAFVPRKQPRCYLLDLGRDCVLPESAAGFRQMGVPVCTEPPSAPSCLVVAGAGSVPDSLTRQLARFVRAGGWLIFESGAGFGGFEAQRETLARHFGLAIQPPVDLWKQGRRTPYADYHWPLKTKIRDFSRAVPVCAARADVIATAGEMPVALRRRGLVFLGSPIGPALRAGDREARAWFSALVHALSGSGLPAHSPVFAPHRSAI